MGNFTWWTLGLLTGWVHTTSVTVVVVSGDPGFSIKIVMISVMGKA